MTNLTTLNYLSNTIRVVEIEIDGIVSHRVVRCF